MAKNVVTKLALAVAGLVAVSSIISASEPDELASTANPAVLTSEDQGESDRLGWAKDRLEGSIFDRSAQIDASIAAALE